VRISEFGGEDALIELVQRRYAARDAGSLIRGIGDDAALVKHGRGKLIIATTDLLVEGTHFRRDIIDPYSLGWKSVAVNISDVAAMAGLPTFALVSVAVDDQPTEFFEQIMCGAVDACNRFSVKLAGGDTNASRGQMVVSVTLLGEVEADRVTLRSTARPGDAIVVTGTLGDSRAGLEMLLRYGLEKATELCPKEVDRHLRPLPRVAEARAAAATGAVTAAMDISDGLAADLRKLCAASAVGARVYANRLPISSTLRKAGDLLQTEPAQLAEAGGEDYELLLAVRPDAARDVISAISKVEGTTAVEIGELTDDADVLIRLPDGTARPLSGGWEHFQGTQDRT